MGTELKGVCFSLFGETPFDPIDLLFEGMHRLKCTLSETYHTTEIKTAQKGLRTGQKMDQARQRLFSPQNGLKKTSKDTPNGSVPFLEKLVFVSWPLLLWGPPGALRV